MNSSEKKQSLASKISAWATTIGLGAGTAVGVALGSVAVGIAVGLGAALLFNLALMRNRK